MAGAHDSAAVRPSSREPVAPWTHKDSEGHSRLCLTSSALGGLSAGQKGFLCKEMKHSRRDALRRSRSPVSSERTCSPVSGVCAWEHNLNEFGDLSVSVTLSSVFSCMEAFLVCTRVPGTVCLFPDYPSCLGQCWWEQSYQVPIPSTGSSLRGRLVGRVLRNPKVRGSVSASVGKVNVQNDSQQHGDRRSQSTAASLRAGRLCGDGGSHTQAWTVGAAHGEAGQCRPGEHRVTHRLGSHRGSGPRSVGGSGWGGVGLREKGWNLDPVSNLRCE